MKIYIFFFLLIFFTACSKKEEAFDTFIFSVAALHEDFSLKINNSDTVFYQNRFRMKVRNYYALPGKSDRDSLLALIDKLDFASYDSIYIQENLMDGTGIRFSKQNGANYNWVFFYGDKGPKELNIYANKFYDWTKKLNFKLYKKEIDFGNLDYLCGPEFISISEIGKTN